MKPEKESRLKVLILDEKKYILSYLKRLCKQLGLVVVTENEPQVVLDRIWNNEFFDILIIDFCFSNFPSNGIYILAEAMRKYVQNKCVPYIPILIITAGTNELFKRDQKNGVIFDFIERPHEDADIKKVLSRAIAFLKRKPGETG